jgi:hypothetical protein
MLDVRRFLRTSRLRGLASRISDLVYARLVADARNTGALKPGPGGQTGNGSKSSVTGSHPAKPVLRKSHSRTSTNTRTGGQPPPENPSAKPLDTKRYSICITPLLTRSEAQLGTDG